MARLSSERLRLHITDIVQCDSHGIENFYERFKLKLTIHGREAVYGVNGEYELCGNIQALIATIDEALNGEEYSEIEFCEPDFRFKIKRFHYSDEMSEDEYQLICWINSGRWNGVYSETEIGCKFHVDEKSIRNFRDGLQNEWDKRKIIDYATGEEKHINE